MGAIIFFFLAVVALLICTPRSERGLAFGSMLMVGAAIWLAVRIKLASILGSIVGTVLALGWEYRIEILLAMGAAIVLVVPLLMIYIAVCDKLDERAAEKICASRMAAWAAASESICLLPVIATSDLTPRRRDSGKKTGIRLEGQKIVFKGHRKLLRKTK